MSAVAIIWHDVECGGYDADLSLWERLAEAAGGRVLDLGCGTGRVTLHLAGRGVAVTAVDVDDDLVAALADRGAGLEVEARLGDVRELDLAAQYRLILAPMQLLQLLGSSSARIRALTAVRAHLAPGGRFAAAIVEGAPAAAAPESLNGHERPLPDIAEFDGRVYSSLPLGAERDRDALVVTRLRQVVSAAGELTETVGVDRLDIVDSGLIGAEAKRAGLAVAERIAIEPTDAHIGSTVLIMEGR